MQNAESDRGDEAARQDEIDLSESMNQSQRKRGRDRREDGGGLFGGYQGPERRSGRDRRANA